MNPVVVIDESDGTQRKDLTSPVNPGVWHHRQSRQPQLQPPAAQCRLPGLRVQRGICTAAGGRPEPATVLTTGTCLCRLQRHPPPQGCPPPTHVEACMCVPLQHVWDSNSSAASSSPILHCLLFLPLLSHLSGIAWGIATSDESSICLLCLPHLSHSEMAWGIWIHDESHACR